MVAILSGYYWGISPDGDSVAVNAGPLPKMSHLPRATQWSVKTPSRVSTRYSLGLPKYQGVLKAEAELLTSAVRGSSENG